MRLSLALLIGAALLAPPVHAQDFLGGLARRAAGAAAARVVEQAITPSAPPPAGHERSRGRQAERAPEARAPNPYADLESLPEADREAACDRRVPKNNDGGRNYEAQLEFGRCMGPRYGDGG